MVYRPNQYQDEGDFEEPWWEGTTTDTGSVPDSISPLEPWEFEGDQTQFPQSPYNPMPPTQINFQDPLAGMNLDNQDYTETDVSDLGPITFDGRSWDRNDPGLLPALQNYADANQISRQGQVNDPNIQEMLSLGRTAEAGDDTYTPPWDDLSVSMPALPGQKAWWEAGEPTHLNFDWQGKDWWPDPENWGDHINRIRDTGEGVRRWEDMPTYQDIPSSAYSWDTAGRTPPPIANYGDFYNVGQRYRDMQFEGSPWGPGQALWRGQNISDHQTEFNQNMENFRLASEMAYRDWQNRPKNGDDDNAARDACLAKGDGSTWDGQNCIPPQLPTPTGEAACVAKGDTWSNPGGEGTCIPRNKPPVNGDNGEDDNGETTSFPQPTVNPIDPKTGVIDEPVQDIDYPFTPPEMQTIGNINLGDDPISQMVNADIMRMAEFGGITPTPTGAQTISAISQILGAGGGGGAAETPFGEDMQQELQELLANAGALPPDPQREAMQFEQLRTPIDRMREAQLAQGQAAMAHRGLLGQGPEASYMEGLESRLAPEYAAAGQQLALQQMQAADARYQQALAAGVNIGQAQAQRREDRLSGALQLSAGLSQQQADNMLRTAATWTDRQRMLTEHALGSLDRDIEWSKFLAEFGLQRDQWHEMARTGRLQMLLPMLQTYLDNIRTTIGGTVPYDVFD